jgi:hypothetical protein
MRVGFGTRRGSIRLKCSVFVVLAVVASAHGCPPNTARNFRKALNKCTRTVA